MVIIFAIFATLLLGAVAIATDLSVSTHYRRTVQNVTDAAALSGASQLPITVTSSDTAKAVQKALELAHNSYGWPTSSGWAASITNSADCGEAALQCSVTVCAGMTSSSPACTKTVTPTNASQPFVLTINSPPKTARVGAYNGDSHRIEVVMHQTTGGFFNAFVGANDQDAAQSIGYHFASNQPFPFALFSRTIIQSGNQGENIAGNIYADRYLYPQSNGFAGICAGPDANHNPGYIFLGYPQLDDGSPPYQNDGQSSLPHGFPIQTSVTCPVAGGTVGMSATPAVTGCTPGYPANAGGYSVYYDAVDGACEANPPIQPPSVAPLPNLPVYTGAQFYGCGGGLVGGIYQPGEYSCSTGPAITVSNAMAAGIYEIDHTAAGGCDVVLNDGADLTAGVTFYLKGGAEICPNPSSGMHIYQTPYNNPSYPLDAGNDKYAVLSDNAGTPQIITGGHGGGSTAGVWNITGVIWLPTGTVTVSNKNAIEDIGQIVVNQWNDQSGNHLNPSVNYNGANLPPQPEQLKLTE